MLIYYKTQSTLYQPFYQQNYDLYFNSPNFGIMLLDLQNFYFDVFGISFSTNGTILNVFTNIDIVVTSQRSLKPLQSYKMI